jgi:hypothetical protein
MVGQGIGRDGNAAARTFAVRLIPAILQAKESLL